MMIIRNQQRIVVALAGLLVLVSPNLAEEQQQQQQHTNNLRHGQQQQQQQQQTVEDVHGRDLQTSSRIVGGSKVDKGEYPYFVQWEGANCGGAVIHEDIVVTAAHCFNPDNPPASRRIRLGNIKRGQGGVTMQYVNTIPHPQYDYSSDNEAYDVLILKTVSSMLDIGTGVEKIELADASILEEGTQDESGVLAVGYGTTSENSNNLSADLRDVLLYYVEDETCANQYPTQGRFESNLMFCSAVPGGGKDTCKGDSGGPMVDFNTGKLVGVVSFGEGCAREDYSGVSTRLSTMKAWIDKAICDNSSFPPATCPSRTPPIESAEGDVSESTVPGGASGGAPANPGTPSEGVPAPLYNPRGDAAVPTQIYNPNASSARNPNTFPGEGPMVATNAVTVNIKYRANSQFVTWTLAKETEQQEGWEPWFRSSRGIDGNLQSQTFEDLAAGWWRFQLTDPQAESRAASGESATIEWMSIMAPRGNNPWARSSGFSSSFYYVYFLINDIGIVAEVKGDPGS